MVAKAEKTLPDGQHKPGVNLNTEIRAEIDPATIDQALVFQQNHTPSTVDHIDKPGATQATTPQTSS